MFLDSWHSWNFFCFSVSPADMWEHKRVCQLSAESEEKLKLFVFSVWTLSAAQTHEGFIYNLEERAFLNSHFSFCSNSPVFLCFSVVFSYQLSVSVCGVRNSSESSVFWFKVYFYSSDQRLMKKTVSGLVQSPQLMLKTTVGLFMRQEKSEDGEKLWVWTWIWCIWVTYEEKSL